MTRVGIFELVNPPEGAETVIRQAIAAINFPWDALLAGLEDDPDGAVIVEWGDTGQGASGLFFGSSITIRLSDKAMHQGPRQAFVFAHEVGHLVDALVLRGTAKRDSLLALFHVGPYVQLGHFNHDHPDAGHVNEWWTNGGEPYPARVYENYADQFVAAYAPGIWDGSAIEGGTQHWPRFVHWTENHQAVRDITLPQPKEPPVTTYTRADIGLRAPEPGPGALDSDQVEGIALHWPAMAQPKTTVESVMLALRAWQRYHMDTKGWSDIAYQVAVDQAGNRYELRGLTTQSGANGDTDVNERFGAVLLVLAPGEQPTAAMIAETQRVIADHRALFPNSSEIVGHATIRPGGTECPGPIVMRLITEGAFNPPLEEEGDMPTPDDLLNEPLNAFDPNGNPTTANVTVREALSAFVIFIREGAPAAKTYLDKAGQSPASAKE